MKTMLRMSWILLSLFLTAGCITVLNNREPYRSYIGLPIPLKTDCYLEEFAATKGGIQKESLYNERGEVTDLVADDILFRKPAKVIEYVRGFEASFYPLALYPKRVYHLGRGDARPSLSFIGGSERVPVGPYRVYPVKAGTPVVIDRVTYTNGIDCLYTQAYGRLKLSDSGEDIQFVCLIGVYPSAIETPW